MRTLVRLSGQTSSIDARIVSVVSKGRLILAATAGNEDLHGGARRSLQCCESEAIASSSQTLLSEVAEVWNVSERFEWKQQEPQPCV